ncbi:MAG: hypothetical protein IJJ80_08710 [Clostridia bacterium]|nr:hypothetical protein [Clostridia bacterium]
MRDKKREPQPDGIGDTVHKDLNKESIPQKPRKRNIDPISAFSNEQMEPVKERRYQMILNVMKGEMTAREICVALGYHDMNMVRPRITELIDKGIVEKCGTTFDTLTQRPVNVFRIAEADHEPAV